MVTRDLNTDEFDGEVSFAGDLVSMPIEDLLGWLSTSTNSGRLVLEGSDHTKTLFVNKGRLTAASSTNPREFLGHYLVGWDVVTEKELDNLFLMRKEHDTLIGQLLISLGLVTPNRLEEILTFVTHELIYEMFDWPGGQFRFVLGKTPAKQFLPLKIDLQAIILEGVRRRDEIKGLRSVIPSDHCRPRSRASVDVNALTADNLGQVREYGGSLTITELAISNQTSSFVMLERIVNEVRSGEVEILKPKEAPEESWTKSLKGMRLHAEECFGRGQLLESWKTVEQLVLEYAKTSDIVQLAADLMDNIHEAANQRISTRETVLDLAVPLTTLKDYECTANEGFLLSRLDGRQTVAAILPQIPGDATVNLLIMIDLIDRGLLKSVT